MAADGNIRQVFDDVVEMIYERGLNYDKIGDGRILRLIAAAEDAFCELTGVLLTEVNASITLNDREHTLSPGGTKVLVEVESIKYNGKPLDIRPYIEGESQPDYYQLHYATDGVMIARETVRLTFDPPATVGIASAMNGLTWFFSYAPGATYTDLSGGLVLSSLYYAYLKAYVMWQLCVSFAPQISHLYERDFYNGVRIHTRLRRPEPIPVKPIKA